MNTFSINQMISFVPAINPEESAEYFLEFSTREEYIQKRTEWRELYAYLSRAIRSNRNRTKTFSKWRSKIARRMDKNGGWNANEFADRVKMATRNAPPEFSTHGFDARELMDVRMAMKRLATMQSQLTREMLAA